MRRPDDVSHLFFHPSDFQRLNDDNHKLISSIESEKTFTDDSLRLLTKASLAFVASLLEKCRNEAADSWPTSVGLLRVLEREYPEIYEKAKAIRGVRNEEMNLMRFVEENNYSNLGYAEQAAGAMMSLRQVSMMPHPMMMMMPRPMAPPQMMANMLVARQAAAGIRM